MTYLQIESLGEKDTELIDEYISSKVIRGIECNNSKFVFCKDVNIDLNEYYKLKNIRKRLSDYSEDFYILKDDNKNIVGFIAFSYDYIRPIYKLNFIHIKEEVLDEFINRYRLMIGELESRCFLGIRKVRVTLEKDNFIWKDVFKKMGFEIEAQRICGENGEIKLVDYIYRITMKESV